MEGGAASAWVGTTRGGRAGVSRAARRPLEHDRALSVVVGQGGGAEEFLLRLLVLAVSAQQIGDDGGQEVMVLRRRQTARLSSITGDGMTWASAS
jgi:hypothetical protein